MQPNLANEISLFIVLAVCVLANQWWRRALRPFALSGDVERIRRWRRNKAITLFICMLPLTIYIFTQTSFTGPKWFSAAVTTGCLLNSIFPDIFVSPPQIMRRLAGARK